MNGNKLFLVVTDLCSNALPLTLPTIISNFNNTGVVRGCIILLPSKFEGRKQIELANERMSVLSPLFEFLISALLQKLHICFANLCGSALNLNLLLASLEGLLSDLLQFCFHRQSL